MSQASSGFTAASQIPHGSSKGPLGAAYIPNEDERSVFREYNSESFWYRSLPFSATAIAIAVTQVMVSKGIIAPSPRFGSLPKVAIAGIFGFISGENVLCEGLSRKVYEIRELPSWRGTATGTSRHMPSELNQSKFADASESQQPGSESVFQLATELISVLETYSSYTNDYTYSSPSQSYDPTAFSSGFSDSGPVGIRDDSSSQAPPYPDEDVPKKKPVLYEELRSLNIENYEMLTQKADTTMKPQAEVAAPKKVKKNKYGDAWDE